MNNWEDIGQTDAIDEMAEKMNSHILPSLDQCAPIKTFKIRNQNKFGISDQTKALIKDRDGTRSKMKNASHTEKVIHFIHSFIHSFKETKIQ